MKRKLGSGDVVFGFVIFVLPPIVILFLLRNKFVSWFYEIQEVPHIAAKVMILLIMAMVIGVFLIMISNGLSLMYVESSEVIIHEKGVICRNLFHKVELLWDEVQELGIGTQDCGTSRSIEKTAKMIYFSGYVLQDEGKDVGVIARDNISSQCWHAWNIFSAIQKMSPKSKKEYIIFLDGYKECWQYVISLEAVQKLIQEYEYKCDDEGRQCFYKKAQTLAEDIL